MLTEVIMNLKADGKEIIVTGFKSFSRERCDRPQWALQ